MLIESEVKFWPRTTYVGKLMTPDEILQIANILHELGYQGEYLIQNYKKSSGTRAEIVADYDEATPEELEPLHESMPSGITLKLEWR